MSVSDIGADPDITNFINAVLAKLRPFQREGIDASLAAYTQGIRRQLLVHATGSGKTVFLATLPTIYQFKRRILVLVNRDRLANQAREKILHWNPTAEVGVEKGTTRSLGTEKFVVGSVQTLGRVEKVPVRGKSGRHKIVLSPRLLALNPDDFDMVVIDECHHAPAESYRVILQYFGFLDAKFRKVNPCPNRLLLGVTATKERMDGLDLHEIFDTTIHTYSIDRGIKEGWLVNVRCRRVRTASDLSKVTTLGDDYNRNELARAVNTAARNTLIVKKWLEYASDRPTIGFAVDVEHAKALAAAFRRVKIKAEAVWGNDRDAKDKIARFREGKLQVLWCCDLLTEGYDDPRASCVLIARPTASISLYIQIVGRGTRLEDGISNLHEARAAGIPITKPDCLVLEIADETNNHLLVDFAKAFHLPEDTPMDGIDLLTAKDKVKRERRARRQMMAAEGFVGDDSADVIEEEVDLFSVSFEPEVCQFSLLQWHLLSPNFYALILPNRGGRVFLYRNSDGQHVVSGTGFPRKTKPFTEIFDCQGSKFADGFSQADHIVRSQLGEKIFDLCQRRTSGGWRDQPAPEAQQKLLTTVFEATDHPLPAEITKGLANMLLGRWNALRMMGAKEFN